ncbi:MAG TPA: response regulator [Thermoanaerobaculia bacterium]|nr:response regulator [Thermoanaerobaculia bacterium]
MELICKQCSAKYRAAVSLPLTQPVRLVCPSCGKQAILKPAPDPRAPVSLEQERTLRRALIRRAVIADEPREFRSFLGSELRQLGFEVTFFDSGEGALEHIREARAELVIVNVYLRGKLGVEISEEIKNDPDLAKTKVVLIGALFRANRFRANPTNLYGADEYIEDQIPGRELREIIARLFPAVFHPPEEHEPVELDEARRLARLILSDIVIYNSGKAESGIRDGNFFEVLRDEIEDGRQYYESRVPFRVRQNTEFFTETLQQFVEMKREELEKSRTGTEFNER